jgi:hypothetical protein
MNVGYIPGGGGNVSLHLRDQIGSVDVLSPRVKGTAVTSHFHLDSETNSRTYSHSHKV